MIAFLFALIAVFLALGAMFGGIHFFWVVLWFGLAVVLLSWFLPRRTLGRLDTERRFVDRAFCDDEVAVTLRIINRSVLPMPWVEVRDGVPTELREREHVDHVVALGPRARTSITYRVHCRRRGWYTVGPVRLRAGDVFGLRERVRAPETTNRLIVYPRIVALSLLGLPTRSALVALPTRTLRFEDPTRITGVRPYQSGDPVRRIHWGATARLDELMVKQYQPAVARETVICLDLDLRDYDLQYRHAAMEQAIVVAASIAHHVIAVEGQAVGLVTEALDPLTGNRERLDLSPRSGSQQLMFILEVLARVQPTKGEQFATVLGDVGVDLRHGSTIVIVTGTALASLEAEIFALQKAGHAVGVVAVQQEETADLPGIPVWRVWVDRHLEAIA